jgi:hypothetical protein
VTHVTLLCDCGRPLVEGTTRLESTAEAGFASIRTTFTCPACNATYTRWTQRPAVHIEGILQSGKPAVHWMPREPRRT